MFPLGLSELLDLTTHQVKHCFASHVEYVTKVQKTWASGTVSLYNVDTWDESHNIDALFIILKSDNSDRPSFRHDRQNTKIL